MTLRCFLFSSDEGTVANIRQILDSLGVEGEPCSDAVTAAEKITNQSFQIVIIDWDQQPEAGVLLNTARERKAAERPLTLAIISNDPSAPQALQAGANSLLRKPIAMNQAKETLTTARDLLRAKQGSAANAQAAAAAASTANVPSNPATLRAGEFLQTPTLAPGGQFETEAPVPHPSSSEVHQLKDLEPMAAAVSDESNAPAASQDSAGAFPGLQAMMRGRSATQSGPTLPPPAAGRGNPELAGFHEISSHAAPATPAPSMVKVAPAPTPIQRPAPSSAQEQQKEDRLFAYIQGEREDEEPSAGGSSLKKRAIILASVLAAGAIIAAPQAPWHPKLQTLWNGGRQSIHGWLYPQPVTPVQAPASHENFGRAGDEYKLPVAENIPDSTTDPSQIQVVPVIDPTIKKPQGDGGQPDQSAVPPDTSPTDTPAQPSGVQTPAGQPAVQPPANQAPTSPTQQTPAATPQPAAVAPPVASQSPVIAVASAATNPPPHSETTAPSTTSFPAPVSAPPKYPQPRAPAMPGNVPSSLKSQMASMTPEASGNKAPETALQSIEPVLVTEAAERALLTAQPSPVYPANAKGQQGSVTLQVLIGRDGTVQDAKFMQGSFLFARAAIDAVRQWKFKPYVMNGRPVSVQAPINIKFTGAQ